MLLPLIQISIHLFAHGNRLFMLCIEFIRNRLILLNVTENKASVKKTVQNELRCCVIFDISFRYDTRIIIYQFGIRFFGIRAIDKYELPLIINEDNSPVRLRFILTFPFCDWNGFYFSEEYFLV